MKLLVFAVCALACLTLANTKPCRGDSCGGYNNKRQFSYGKGYSSQAGSRLGQASSNANVVGGGTSTTEGSDYGGGIDDISGDSDDMDRGYGGYDRYNGYRGNSNCRNCYVENIGVGGPNMNTIRIPTED